MSQDDVIAALKDGPLSWPKLVTKLQSDFGLSYSAAKKNVTSAKNQDRIIAYQVKPAAKHRKIWMYRL